MQLRQIMRLWVVDIGPDERLSAARHLMRISGVRHLPVVLRHELLGVVGERDILAACDRLGRDRGLASPVSAAMSSPAQVASPEEPTSVAASRMLKADVGCLPVVLDGEIVGIVTRSDILEAHSHLDDQVADSARGVMTPLPRTVLAGDRVIDAGRRMERFSVRHLPVVDGTGRLVGMLSDRDVRSAQAEGGFESLVVRDVMARTVLSAGPDTAVEDLAGRMADARVGALPIVDEEDQLLGVVSYVDLLRTLTPGPPA